jgi:hypothetical protein
MAIQSTMITTIMAAVIVDVVHQNANSGCSFCGDKSHIAWSCPKRNRPK